MRLPQRVVGDYHVDRQEMYGQRCPQSTCTNSPRSFRPVFDTSRYLSQDIYCGGYSGGEPPLPIPNREVKPAIADGTAPPGGRVGSCRSLDCRTSKDARQSSFMPAPAGINQRTTAAASEPSIEGRTPQTPCVASLRSFRCREHFSLRQRMGGSPLPSDVF